MEREPSKLKALIERAREVGSGDLRVPIDGLETARLLLGMNRAQVAERLDITNQATLKLERGWRTRVAAIERYVKALGGKLALTIELPGAVLVMPADSGDVSMAAMATRDALLEAPRVRRPSSPKNHK